MELMRERNKGIPQVAEATGIPRKTLYDYLHRRTPVFGSPHRQEIADALDANVGWLNGLDIPRDKETNRARPKDRRD